MKKFIKILLCTLCLCLPFSGCNGEDHIDMGTSNPSSDNADQTQTEGETDAATTGGDVAKQPWVKSMVNGVSVRQVSIDIAGDGEAIEIVQLSDVHFNAINDKDRAENHELVMNSYNDKTLWLKDAASLGNLQRCLDYAKNADQIVVTGDTISYLSHGNLELVKKYIFDPYPNALVCVGNHDAIRCWDGKADESATLAERLKLLQDYWGHDIYYTSKVIDERVMVIQLENAARGGIGAFWESQLEPFMRDLGIAREKGYSVLLFYHIPLATGNVKNYSTRSLSSGGATVNFYTGSFINAHSAGVDGEMYNLIVNNGDIIKGAFCGHQHADYYTEFKAKTADGAEVYIPQYVLTALPYDQGHVIKIVLK